MLRRHLFVFIIFLLLCSITFASAEHGSEQGEPIVKETHRTLVLDRVAMTKPNLSPTYFF